MADVASLMRRLPRRRLLDTAHLARFRPRWTTIGRIAGFGLLAALCAAFIFVVDCAFEIPIGGAPAQTSSALVIKAADGSELATRGTVHGETLKADEISDNLGKAIVAIEDRRFYSHGAIDPHGIFRAMLRDVWRGRVREGASTLTQQLARLMLLSPERTLRRKVQEILIAAWLEHHLTKPEILAKYLDTAYFGAGAYGADAAAQRYFGKSARDLDLPEAAMLAGLVRAPSQLAPHRNFGGAEARAKLVLSAMVKTGAITKPAAEQAIAHPAKLKVDPEAPPGPGYVADLAAADVKALVGDAVIDLSARTTIDAQLQSNAERIIAGYLDREGAQKHVSQAALVALAPDGRILAMIGGRDYAASRFNRATQAKRQAGSLFKLFVYMTALQKGATPDTRVVDRPVKIGDWEPHNYENRYSGQIRLSDAFAHSVNTVAAELGQEFGIEAVIKTARDLGVESKLPDVPSLALGTADVTLLEMTRSYATVASDQDKVEPYLIQRITAGGKVLMNRPQRYASEPTSSAAKTKMRELLADVVREGTGRAARLPFPTGGKTGTTQDFRDAWFIGSAPDITIGVWVGNDDDSPTNGVTGGDLPARIWRDVVVSAESAIERKAATEQKAAASAKVAATAPPIVTARSVARDDAEPGIQADPASPKDQEISGTASVLDTSRLAINGHEIRLLGVAPLGGLPARALARHLGRRDVSCTPAKGGMYSCSVDGDDLATVILANGGAEATADAPNDLVAAQDAAHAGRRGIWRWRRF